MADTLDLVDIEEAKAYLGIKGNLSDARLSTRITAVGRRLDQGCGAIVQRTITGEAHDGGGNIIRLHHPAAAFTSVTEYQGTSAQVLTRETIGTAASNAYYAEPHGPDPTLYSGVLRRREGGYDASFYRGTGNIAVTYTAGRYTTTATVAPHFKEAALVMLQNLSDAGTGPVLQQGEYTVPGTRFPTFAIPNAVKQLLWQEWREIPGVG